MVVFKYFYITYPEISINENELINKLLNYLLTYFQNFLTFLKLPFFIFLAGLKDASFGYVFLNKILHYF